MDIEYITIDNIKYGIFNEIKDGDYVYVFLANIENPADQLIKKYNIYKEDELLPLNGEDEFYYALSLFNE